MFESIEDQEEKLFFITVELTQVDLEKKAEQLEYKVKLLDRDIKYKYNVSTKEIYEPLRSKDINEIYFAVIKKVIPIYDLKKEGKTIKDYQFIHDLNEQNDILEKFGELNVLMILKQNFIDLYFQEYHAITTIKNYLGERWGF